MQKILGGNIIMRSKFGYILKIFGYFIGAVVIVQVLLQVYLELDDIEFEDFQQHVIQLNPSDVSDSVVLWWTPFEGNSSYFRQCGQYRCYFTGDRRYLDHNGLQAVMFYGSKLDVLDLPLARAGSRLAWALLHEESPKNLPALCHEEMLSLFNFSSTFSRHSDVPLTLQYLDSVELLTTRKYLISTAEKDSLLGELAPVLYIQSSCSAPSGRDSYVQELAKHVAVDSYGKCLQNKKLPYNISNRSEGEDSDDFLRFVAQYKFTLALENAVCEDYVTEKLWRPLIVGSVPVYLGSPSVIDWLPNNESAILVSDFRSPRELAEHLLRLNANVSAYERHLRHKRADGVDNRKLLSAMRSRPPGRGWGRYVRRFECLACEASQAVPPQLGKTAGRLQYDCPEPVSPLTGRPDRNSLWNQVWQTGLCEAKLARAMVMNNRRYSEHEYSQRLLELAQAGEC